MKKHKEVLKEILSHSVRALLYRLFPTSIYFKFVYYYRHKCCLDLKKPQKFTEKLYWLKVYNRIYLKEKIQLCYDKYTVRQYVIEKGLEEILVPIIGVYNNPEEINFSTLPQKFVLKITQSCGYNIICPNKNIVNVEETKKILKKWLKRNRGKHPRGSSEERYMFNGKAKILCETFLEKPDGNIPEDLRFFCFNGEPKYIVCDVGTTEKNGEHGKSIVRNTYDLNWNLIPVNLGRQRNEHILCEKPKNLNRMIQIAERLSEDFPFVRVDLYNIDGEIFFGELTWIPMGGDFIIEPECYEYCWGSLLQLPKKINLDFE